MLIPQINEARANNDIETADNLSRLLLEVYEIGTKTTN